MNIFICLSVMTLRTVQAEWQRKSRDFANSGEITIEMILKERALLMCMYGYCRISTKQQSIDRQIRNIKGSYDKAVIIQEVYTGTKRR